jgi:SAM-dependent methyltransferase
MTNAEFDEFANTYADVTSENSRFFDPDYNYFARYRADIVSKNVDCSVEGVLDFGCGIGLGIRPLCEAFPNSRIVGCDLSKESLARARAFEPSCDFVYLDAIQPTPQFDVIVAASVLHHIEPSGRHAALRYCYERLRPGGRLFVFEHNPFNPVTRHLVARCPVDRHAILLTRLETITRLRQAGFNLVTAKYCLFFPKALALLRPLEKTLGWLPLGGQYFVAGARVQRAI